MKRLFLAAACLLALAIPAFAQSVPIKYDSAASTNPTLVRAGFAQLHSIVVLNSTAAVYWLKFFDVAVVPTPTTCGTNTVVWKMPVPFGASSAGGGFVVSIPDGLQFNNGIAFCLVGAQADSDVSNAATGIVINLGVKQ